MPVQALPARQIDHVVFSRKKAHILPAGTVEPSVRIIVLHKSRQRFVLHIGFLFHIVKKRRL